ncbi:DNA repair protein RecO [Algicella marina]|uniref:DNA repair protein RecO n=1 Tax=Algicella marina TaxID=2683284 RepID=A0A6P1T8X5_9RHOB|nr:DNA repair protein RecO [Algicella marina]QHQ37082.1 DNA repair protein RecO [Algicella marina]
MEWQDSGILLATRPHGETSAIVEILTVDHGRHAGIVRGGVSRRLRPVLQPGSGVHVTWRARLEAHLGTFTVEPEKSRAHLLSSRTGLAGLNAITAMARALLPEREPFRDQYQATKALLDRMDTPDWPAHYILWEIRLLEGLGYRLTLQNCAVTGISTGLAYVSPKSGHAVTAEAGAEYADRLLPLPPFLRPEASDIPISREHLQQGMALTGHFLRNWVCHATGVEHLPPARERLEAVLTR